jgi:hypothetical protein
VSCHGYFQETHGTISHGKHVAVDLNFLHNLHLTQVQLDELYAVLRAVRDGAVSEDEAITSLSRSPHWV